jgi:spermidine synthase
VVGDARVSLAEHQDARYDLLVIDAFSSDAIPVHLLTREAVALYLARLAPGGVLAFHTSNRHLALMPVVARIAANVGAVALYQSHDLAETGAGPALSDSEWVVVARNPTDIAALSASGLWRSPQVNSATTLWTDDFSNILTTLR